MAESGYTKPSHTKPGIIIKRQIRLYRAEHKAKLGYTKPDIIVKRQNQAIQSQT